MAPLSEGEDDLSKAAPASIPVEMEDDSDDDDHHKAFKNDREEYQKLRPERAEDGLDPEPQAHEAPKDRRSFMAAFRPVSNLLQSIPLPISKNPDRYKEVQMLSALPARPVPLSAVLCGRGKEGYEPREIAAEKLRMTVVLNTSLVAFLGPISTTVYTPVLTTIQTALNATASEVMATVSAYLIISGVMPLLWGPFSDVFGRKKAFLISTVIFTAFSLAAAFSWNIGALMAFRVLAAIGASSTLTVGAGAIADTHHPSVRGKAMGYFLLGPLLGPVIGPTIGGLLAEHLGWRSIFYFLTAMGSLATICMMLFLPETLPRLPPGTKRRLPRPWEAFTYLKIPGILAVTVMAAVSYTCFYITVITFPLIMTNVFNVSVSEIGFFMIISGLGTMLGSVIGGRIADFSAKGKTLSYRLISTVIGQILFIPVFITIGWTYEVHKAFPVALSFFIGFFFTFPRPGLTTYAIELGAKVAKKQVASTISGLIYACMYLAGGVGSQLSVIGRESLGTGAFFSICAAVTTVVSIPVAVIMFVGMKREKQELLNQPEEEFKLTTSKANPKGLEEANRDIDGEGGDGDLDIDGDDGETKGWSGKGQVEMDDE